MDSKIFTRRDFLKTAGVVTAVTVVGGIPSSLFGDELKLVRFPEKQT